MTEAELSEIEAALGICLPADYRKVMLDYPFPPDSWPAQAEMPDLAEALILENRRIREESACGPDWQDHYFAFGHTSGGDTFFVDTMLESSAVFRIDGETLESHQDAESLSDWVTRRIKWYVDFDLAAAARKYETLTAAVEAAGFFASPVEPMGGWDRICLASQKMPNGGYAGHSYWVTRREGTWYLGTWGGSVFRLEDADRIADCCIAWLQRATEGTLASFDEFANESSLGRVEFPVD